MTVPAPTQRRSLRLLKTSGDILPGLLLAAGLALVATLAARGSGLPVMLLALLFGYLANLAIRGERCGAGIDFVATTILRLGVGLLGARITFDEITALGVPTLVGIPAIVVATILIGIGLSRLFGRGTAFGVLAGGATAICGASAALAISAALPKSKSSERQVVFVIIGVTTLSTIAMVLYPLGTQYLGLDELASGILFGASIHDVAQVVGAGYAVSDLTGDLAVTTKLYRVALLVPCVALVALSFAGTRSQDGARQPVLPWFLLLFIGLVVASSFGVLRGQEQISSISAFLLVMAIAALGYKTSFGAMARIGPAASVILVAETFVILGLSLGLALYVN